MLPPFFPNAVMELYSYSQTTGEYTEWGEPLPQYTLRDKIEVDFQPISASSSLKEYGKILQDTYVVYMPIETEIYDTDLVKIEGVTYELIGSVETWNHIIHHKRCTLRKHRKQDGL